MEILKSNPELHLFVQNGNEPRIILKGDKEEMMLLVLLGMKQAPDLRDFLYRCIAASTDKDVDSILNDLLKGSLIKDYNKLSK